MKNSIDISNCLFNFSASNSGGGLKRLIAYSEWFNNKGGTNFIVHAGVEGIVGKYSKNKYFFIRKNNLLRLFNDCYYLKGITKGLKKIDLYFSYGIPVYEKTGRVNWFHLSNVLPLATDLKYMSLPLKLKFHLLGRRIIRNASKYDVVSAESEYSLNLLKKKIDRYDNGLVLSNGYEKELPGFDSAAEYGSYAAAVGTYKYKSLPDTYRVFLNLKKQDKDLYLVIIGPDNDIPKELLGRKDIRITGEIKRQDVVEYLKKARYFISTSIVENSSNATYEGLLLAGESYISDIPPHRELLKNCKFQSIQFNDVKMPILFIKGDEKIKIIPVAWDEVVNTMLRKTNNILFKQ